MTTALRDQIAAALHAHDCGSDAWPLHLTPSRLAAYTARADAVMGVVAPALAAAVVEGLDGRDADFSWSPTANATCGAHNADGTGPLCCVRPVGHAPGHEFAATNGVHTKTTEGVQT